MGFKVSLTMTFLVLSTLLVGCGGGGDGGVPPTKPPPVQPPPAQPPVLDLTATVKLVTNAFTDEVIDQKVGANGGTIEVTTGPLAGLSIVIPADATDEDIAFTISYSDLSSLDGLADGLLSGDKVVRIRALGSQKWNEYKVFNRPLTITLPYSGFDSSIFEDSIRAYFLEPELSSFESESFISLDIANKTVTFEATSFANIDIDTTKSVSTKAVGAAIISKAYSDYVMIGFDAQKFSEFLGGASLDTQFRPSKNGFYIPNNGSFFHDTSGGACKGMSVFSKYYFQKGYSPALYSNYKDDEPTTTWLDDAAAIQLAARVQHKYNWQENGLEKRPQTNAYHSALSVIGTILVTGKPTMISLYQRLNSGSFTDSAHATLAYQVDVSNTGFVFHIYDPNYRGDDTRKINYEMEAGQGGWDLYYGGTTAENTASNSKYNVFYNTGYRAGYTPEMLEKLKRLADNDFAGDDRFPTFTLKKITEKRSGEVIFDIDDPGATSDEEVGIAASGQKMYIMKDSAVIIEGTVIGGAAQEEGAIVNNLNIRTEGDIFDFPINNSVGSGDGSFSFTLPLLSGENSIAMTAIQKDSPFYEWAAFEMLIIKSEYRPAALSATLTWNAGDSDIDLWVKEPGGESVGYSHRAGLSTTTPYLDFDNTEGYGPEHYIALDGMYIPGSDDGLFGTYNIYANYYDDDDEDYENDRAIPWTISWKHLDYCYLPCENLDVDGVWVSGSSSGVLTAIGENSAPIVIEYETGDPEDYKVSEIIHSVTLP